MNKRVEELMAARAPNQSGVDAAAVLKALAGSPDSTRTPSTYAYGMRVDDAYKAAQLGAANQQQREASIQNYANQAIQQDKLQFDMAMKAHDQYLAERNQLINERVAGAEMAYKRALQSRVASDIEKAKMDNERLMLDIEREKQLDALTIDVPDAGNPGQTRKMPVRAFLGSGGTGILRYLSGEGFGGKKTNETAADRAIRRKAEVYTSKGMPEDDAYLLAASKPDSSIALINKAIDKQVQGRKLEFGGYDFGTKGTDKDGKEIPKTEDEFRLELYNKYVDSYFPMLTEDSRALLKTWGPGAEGILSTPEVAGVPQDEESEEPQQAPLFSQDSIDALTRALIERYK